MIILVNVSVFANLNLIGSLDTIFKKLDHNNLINKGRSLMFAVFIKIHVLS